MKKYRWSLTTLICSWSELVGCLVIVWTILSYGQIVANNIKGNYKLSDWNFIKIMIEMDERINKI